MNIQVPVREAFKRLYREARAARPTAQFDSAYWLAERATDSVLRGGPDAWRYDHRPFLEASRAVVWALHWRFFKPSKHRARWASERHIGFSLTEHGSTVWYDKPRLP